VAVSISTQSMSLVYLMAIAGQSGVSGSKRDTLTFPMTLPRGVTKTADVWLQLPYP